MPSDEINRLGEECKDDFDDVVGAAPSFYEADDDFNRAIKEDEQEEEGGEGHHPHQELPVGGIIEPSDAGPDIEEDDNEVQNDADDGFRLPQKSLLGPNDKRQNEERSHRGGKEEKQD